MDRQFNVKSLGVDNDGILGQRHVPAECFGKMGRLLLYLCLSERVRKRDLQVAAGRILRFVLRNKCTAVSLDQVWTAIANWNRPGPLPLSIVTEFLSALCLLPLCYTDLRLRVDPLPCCSDASEAGYEVSMNERS